ncbi:hypothetical protein P7C70_g1294, partial [Phenoliferia sp. Uapishka_3]
AARREAVTFLWAPPAACVTSTDSFVLSREERTERLAIGHQIVAGTYVSSYASLPSSGRSSTETLAPTPLKIDSPTAALTLEIISSSAPQLVGGIKTHKWTSTQVLVVYIKRSLAVNEQTNAITEVVYAEALERARSLDEEFERTGKLVGPLHGVPCSFKDQFDIAGVDTTIGFTQRVGFPAKEDSFIVRAIKEAGGVPFVKSNVPQTMLSFECGNPLGTTSNPYDRSRVPGGSSGGEAALLAADGSPLGFGSDTTLGPMGRSVEDLELSSRLLFNASAKFSRTLDLLPLPFREIELPKKLKVGYYLSATEALEIFVGLSSAGGFQTLLSGLKGDPQEPALWLATLGPKLPWLVRVFASFVLHSIVGDHQMGKLVDASRYKTVTDMQTWQQRKQNYVKKFRQEVWGEMNLDMILCATQATPALKIGQTKDLSPLALGTILYNVVDCSAGVVPVTFVDPAKDKVPDDYWETGPGGSKLVEGLVYGGRKRKGVYDPEEMAGLPVGVQIVGGEIHIFWDSAVSSLRVIFAAQWEEEKVLKMMKEVDDALGPRGFGPGEYFKRTQYTNDCGTKDSASSKCQTLIVNNAEDFCLWAPPSKGTVGDNEGVVVSWCTATGHGSRLMPKARDSVSPKAQQRAHMLFLLEQGALTGVHFVQTPHYLQITGTGDFTKMDISKGDEGGELDPHGADGKGNPVGGTVIAKINGKATTITEWTEFISGNLPGNYQKGKYSNCKGADVAMPNKLKNGGTSTFHQGQKVTPAGQPAPSSSKCTAISSPGGKALRVSALSGSIRMGERRKHGSVQAKSSEATPKSSRIISSDLSGKTLHQAFILLSKVYAIE